MNSRLPDVATHEKPAVPATLDWVGMQGIDLPVTLPSGAAGLMLAASADIQVDLPSPEVKGIHMSRLYRLLNDATQAAPLSPALVERLLGDAVQSHADCGSTRARVALSFPLLVKSPGLVTPGIHGWKSYPVQIEGTLRDGRVDLRLSVSVLYSSTCPCSAALARQIVGQEFDEAFADREQLSREDIRNWIAEHATAATPHSQRSQARVSVRISPYATAFEVERLIAAVEAAVATPVQTAVKRADEQVFAWLNGQNLMYVEDAARKIADRLKADYENASVQVVHMESLHPHDAIASVSSFDNAPAQSEAP